MTVKISRRSFLKGLAALAVSSGISIPAFSSTRHPYVKIGQVVNYIGRSPGGFIGGQIVNSVGEWDGAGYLVKVWNNAYGKNRVIETYYDTDLSMLREEVPKNFWSDQKNNKYPNIHTFVRMKRYGETMSEAIKKMNLASSEKWLAGI